jgi:acyl carrier protein
VTNTVFEQVCQIAAETFEVPERDVTRESSPQTLANWDSIAHLNFVLALETRFNIELSAQEMEGVRSVADAVKIVESRQALS